jgi:hypothetical protein
MGPVLLRLLFLPPPAKVKPLYSRFSEVKARMKYTMTRSPRTTPRTTSCSPSRRRVPRYRSRSPRTTPRTTSRSPSRCRVPRYRSHSPCTTPRTTSRSPSRCRVPRYHSCSCSRYTTSRTTSRSPSRRYPQTAPPTTVIIGPGPSREQVPMVMRCGEDRPSRTPVVPGSHYKPHSPRESQFQPPPGSPRGEDFQPESPPHVRPAVHISSSSKPPRSARRWRYYHPVLPI